MSELTLATPEQLTQVVESLVLTASDKFELNKRMANRARQFFRQQIRAQRDIDNNPYQSRRKRKKTRIYKDIDGKVYSTALNTTNNKNMLMGFSRSLRTYVSDDSFEVGIKGIAGKVAAEHNEGQSVSFTTRANGFYNSKTSRWEGGTLTKNNYRMTKRTLIGWAPELEQELIAMAAEYFVLQLQDAA
ncbi:phage virion morphogenesis protein [Vibrio sp. 10N.286.49.E1]|uniref:phage virion morphogenesis protein n=1 Tax=unclassified Vibrio TaxID=2614977 RepID=UPI00354B6D9D